MLPVTSAERCGGAGAGGAGGAELCSVPAAVTYTGAKGLQVPRRTWSAPDEIPLAPLLSSPSLRAESGGLAAAPRKGRRKGLIRAFP